MKYLVCFVSLWCPRKYGLRAKIGETKHQKICARYEKILKDNLQNDDNTCERDPITGRSYAYATQYIAKMHRP